MSIEQTIAQHASGVTGAAINESARSAARRGILDTIGCILAAAAAPGIDVLVSIAKAWGGREEGSVIGLGFACPAPVAAWINGSMARALEIDDCTDFLPLHPSAALVPPLLAIAEARGGITGEDLVTATAVGQDLIIRLASATRFDGITSGRYNLFKIFGITAALARALRLDAEQTHHAMGLALGSVCGEAQSALDGSLAFRLQDGNAAQAAVTAVLMAERGFTGPRDFLTGRMGFFTSFEPDPQLDRITDALGLQFRGQEMSLKLYSACRCTHTAIGLALELRGRQYGTPESIQSILVSVATAVNKLVGAPIADSNTEVTQAAAQFSIAYTVAAALICGDVFLQQLTPQNLNRSDILNLARKITVVADPDMEDKRFVTGRTRMQICFQGKAPVHLEGVEPPGNPANPATDQMLVSKFIKCVQSAARPLVEIDASQLAGRLMKVEAMADVGLFVRELR